MKDSSGVFWNALLTAVILTLLAGLFVAAMPPVYRATATVEADSEHRLLLQSAELLEEVAGTTDANLDELSGLFEQVFTAQPDKVTLLASKMRVAAGAEPGWTTISVEARRSETAVQLADDIAAAFAARLTSSQLSPEQKALLFAEVTAVDEQIKSLADSNPAVLDYTVARARLAQQQRSYSAEQRTLLQQLNRSEQQLAAIRRGDHAAIRESGIVRAEQRLAAAKIRAAQLANRYGDGHQKMKAAEAEVDAAKALFQQVLTGFEATVLASLEKFKQQAQRLDNRLRALQGQARKLDADFADYKNLMLDRDSSLRRFEGLSDLETRPLVAAAVIPGSTFGVRQWQLLLAVFTLSFIASVLLMLVSSRRRSG